MLQTFDVTRRAPKGHLGSQMSLERHSGTRGTIFSRLTKTLSSDFSLVGEVRKSVVHKQ